MYRRYEAYFRRLNAARAASDNSSSQNPTNRTPTAKTPELVDRQPPVKEQPGSVVQPETQLADQPIQSEAWKKQAQEEADVAKKQVAEMSEKLQDSRQQLDEISAYVGSRVQELRKMSHVYEQDLESELDAVKKRHSLDSAALAAAMVGVTVQLDFAQATIVEMERELRRLRVQSDQWRKEVKAAAALLSGNKNGKFVAWTGSLDSHTIGSKLNSLYSEYLKDESLKKKYGNMLKKFGAFMKKGQKQLVLYHAHLREKVIY